MNFFFKKPKCKDIDYVENTFLALLNTYPDEKFSMELTDRSKYSEKMIFSEFEMIIRQYADHLGLKIKLLEIDEIDELEYNLPVIYNCEEILISDQYVLQIGLTPFALDNLDVAICEIIILLVDVKLTKDGYIEFEEDFIADMENKYRPFLTLTAFYFGIGLPLIKRYWISGNYKHREVLESFSFKYYVPQDLECMIYAHSLFLLQSFENSENINYTTKELEKGIIKELKVCLAYIEKGKSIFINLIRSKSKSELVWK